MFVSIVRGVSVISRCSGRRSLWALVLAVSAAGAAPALAADKLPAIAPDARQYELSNGLELVVIPDHRAPIATHMIWYKVGAADDPPGKSGIAHFLEHLMFKGTKLHPLGSFSAKISENGGTENAFTGEDSTTFYQTVGKDQLKTVMTFEADRMEGLQLTDSVVLPERDVILEERRMRIDNQPGALLSEAIEAALYQNHHYGIPTIGWEQEMKALTKEDAISQYDKYYTPNNAIVVISGDVDPDTVYHEAQEIYGAVPRRSEPGDRHRAMEPPARAARTLTMFDSRVAQPVWSRRYLVPSYSSGKAGEAEALEILADVLGGNSNSRLYASLVTGNPVANVVGAYYLGQGLDYGRFGLYATPREGVTVDRLNAALDKVIADVRDHGITADELARAKKRTRAAAIYAQDNQGMLARIIGNALVSGQNLADVQQWPSRIDAVTLDDVANAAKKYLDDARSVTGTLLPETANRS